MGTKHSALTGAELHYPFYSGLDANKPASPTVNDWYWATDTNILYRCLVAGTWVDAFAGRPKKNWLRNGLGEVSRISAHTLVKDVYETVADRWYGMATGTAVSAGTLTQDTASNCGGRTLTGIKFSGMTLTGTGIIYLRQRIEARDAVKLKNQTVSFGCRCYHTVGSAINYTVYFNKANASDDFSAVTAISNSGAISVPDTTATVLKYEAVALGDCSNGLEVIIKVEPGAITTKNFEFTELQLEIGNKISEFNFKPIKRPGMELIYSTILTSAVTSVDITGLNGNDDTDYELIVRAVNAYNGVATVDLTFNNVGGTSYGYQSVVGESTTVSASSPAGSASQSFLYFGGLHYWGVAHMKIHAKTSADSNFARLGFIQSLQGGGADVVDLFHFGFVFNDYTNNITSMKLTASQANAIHEGTTIELWAKR